MAHPVVTHSDDKHWLVGEGVSCIFFGWGGASLWLRLLPRLHPFRLATEADADANCLKKSDYIIFQLGKKQTKQNDFKWGNVCMKGLQCVYYEHRHWKHVQLWNKFSPLYTFVCTEPHKTLVVTEEYGKSKYGVSMRWWYFCDYSCSHRNNRTV